MTWEHLKTFVWLRWRLMANQWRRLGKFNSVLMTIIAILALLTAIPIFFGSIALGVYAIPRARPAFLMYAWDGLLLAFLMFWSIGLLTDLQRSEPLALSKFMHLPVSANGAFLINYLSSILRLSTIVFVPAMLGYSLALIYTQGAWQIPSLLLVGAFLLMVTALTYQFQGWLASLMSDPRRRRSVIVIFTMAFVLVFQLPNLLNFMGPKRWIEQKQVERAQRLASELATLDSELKAGKIDAAEQNRRREALMEAQKQANHAEDLQQLSKVESMAEMANMVLPIGWLPIGVKSAAEGSLLPALLGFVGMTTIGLTSLRWAYRTSVGQYQQKAASRKPTVQKAVAQAVSTPVKGSAALEAQIPGVSEPATAVALAGLRALLRAPEVKMILLSPLITGVIFGSMLWNNRNPTAEIFRPLIALGLMLFGLMGLLQLMGNQFGFDRDGFRVFVLCSASRRDILLGKNLSYLPIAIGLSLVPLLIVEVVCPMKLSHLLAMVPLFATMFLIFCLFANLLSILAPQHLAPGSLKASNPRTSTVLLQLLMFLLLFPLSQLPILLPIGVEYGMDFMGWSHGLPVALLIAIVECLAVVGIYLLLLRWQGDLLQEREQKILEVVTARAV